MVGGLLQGDFGKVWEGIKQLVGAILSQIANSIRTWFNNARNIVETVGKTIVTAAEAVGKGIFRGVTAVLEGIGNAVWNLLQGIGRAIANGAETILGWGASVANRIKTGS